MILVYFFQFWSNVQKSIETACTKMTPIFNIWLKSFHQNDKMHFFLNFWSEIFIFHIDIQVFLLLDEWWRNFLLH